MSADETPRTDGEDAMEAAGDAPPEMAGDEPPPAPPPARTDDEENIEPPSLEEHDDAGIAAGLVALPRDMAVFATSATASGTRLFFGSLKATLFFLFSRRYRRETAFPFIRAVLLLNWSRVLLEVIRTRDMLALLEKYAVGEKLSRKEKALVRAQLVDIARSVPALGIFALPGGALLLPILAKLLPFDIAPSAFSMEQEDLDEILRAKAATILGEAPDGTFAQWEKTRRGAGAQPAPDENAELDAGDSAQCAGRPPTSPPT